MSKVEARLKSLGLTLPEPPKPIANYVTSVRTGNLVFLAGHGPGNWPDGTPCTGKLGSNLSIERGYEAARLVGLAALASLKANIGDLDRVKRIVKILCMVNGTPDFIDQPKVANGFSDLMVAAFGEKGKHARSAVGMGSLPMGIPVEVELVVEVEG
jgi:enamine deaminase RidA (YjgF/YER057c/UK114 family)